MYCLLRGSVNYLHEKVTVRKPIFLYKTEEFYKLLFAFFIFVLEKHFFYPVSESGIHSRTAFFFWC